MTAFNGTVTLPAKAGELGQQHTGILEYTLVGALANTDTITWTNALPNKAQAKVVKVVFASPELDTNASPTGTATIGDGTDADGYAITFNLGKPVQAPANGEQIVHVGTGAIIGTATQAGTSVVLTVTGVMATSATSGRIVIYVTVEGI